MYVLWERVGPTDIWKKVGVKRKRINAIRWWARHRVDRLFVYE
jgi:hypothetical protein